MTATGRRFFAASLLVFAGACTNQSTDVADASVSTLASTLASTPASTPTQVTVVTSAVPVTEPPPPASAGTTVSSISAATEPPPCGALPIGVTDTMLTGGGVDHPVRIFVPTTFAGGLLATVLDWHGLGSNGPQQALFSGYEAVAEAEGFMVVHPTGVPDEGKTSNSWQLFDTGGSRDDVAFAGALIDELTTNWCADPNRVYSTGMSNGGFFTARLVCEMSDRIAAAASVAGTYHADTCFPSRPVPYIAFHGTDDAVVPFDGGGKSLLGTADAGPEIRIFFEQVIPDEFAEFAAGADCDLEPIVGAAGDDVIRYDYSGCSGATPMSFFEITGGGHTWPGSPLADAVAGALGHTTDAVDATADGWAFMQQHRLDD